MQQQTEARIHKNTTTHNHLTLHVGHKKVKKLLKLCANNPANLEQDLNKSKQRCQLLNLLVLKKSESQPQKWKNLSDVKNPDKNGDKYKKKLSNKFFQILQRRKMNKKIVKIYQNKFL